MLPERIPVRILFLAAAPTDAAHLALGTEIHDIEAALAATPAAGRFEIRQQWAARPEELQAALLHHQPHIVHFSGHGEDAGGAATLVFEDAQGLRAPIAASVLGQVFRVHGAGVGLVVLNACSSTAQAEAIAPHVGAVVAMSGAVSDAAAVAFAAAFYQALAYGKPVSAALEAGKVQISLVGSTKADAPRLFARDPAGAAQTFGVPASAGEPPPPPVVEVPEPVGGPPSIHPLVGDLFAGRARERDRMHRVLDVPGRVPRVVVLQGVPGVGKSYLADRYAYESYDRFPGGYVEISMAAGQVYSADDMAGRMAGKLGLPWGGPGAWPTLAARLASPRTLVHLENVDAEAAAAAVAALHRRLQPGAVIVSGRFRGLGASAGWEIIEVPPLDEAEALVQLQRELRHAFPDPDLLRLARELGCLPLALHLAAGYLNRGSDVDGFLETLHEKSVDLHLKDPADPVYDVDAARAMLVSTFEISLGLLRGALGSAADAGMAGLCTLAFTPPSGFGDDLGPAVSGLARRPFFELIEAAVSLSLLTEVTPPRRTDRAWCLQPLLAEILHKRADPADDRVGRTTDWFVARLDAPAGASPADRNALWAEVERERDALAAWLAEVRPADCLRVMRAGSVFVSRNGPFAAWLAFAERALAAADPAARPETLGLLTRVALRAGALDRAESAAREKLALDRQAQDLRGVVFSLDAVTEVIHIRGDPAEALRLIRAELIPACDEAHDPVARAVALCKSVAALRGLGRREEGLQILRDEVLPVLAGPENQRDRAVAVDALALILKAQGQLAEALRLLREEAIPIFEAAGDERRRAMALRKVADVLDLQGDTGGALAVIAGVIPIFSRLGDVRERAIAERLAAVFHLRLGQPEAALPLLRDAALPTFLRLGDDRMIAFTYAYLAEALAGAGRLDESRRFLDEEAAPRVARLPDPGGVPLVQRVRAVWQEASGDRAEAARLYRDEVAPGYLAVGVQGQWAYALEQAARLLALLGDRAQATHLLADLVAPFFERTAHAPNLARVRATLAQLAAPASPAS